MPNLVVISELTLVPSLWLYYHLLCFRYYKNDWWNIEIPWIVKKYLKHYPNALKDFKAKKKVSKKNKRWMVKFWGIMGREALKTHSFSKNFQYPLHKMAKKKLNFNFQVEYPSLLLSPSKIRIILLYFLICVLKVVKLHLIFLTQD